MRVCYISRRGPQLGDVIVSRWVARLAGIGRFMSSLTKTFTNFPRGAGIVRSHLPRAPLRQYRNFPSGIVTRSTRHTQRMCQCVFWSFVSLLVYSVVSVVNLPNGPNSRTQGSFPSWALFQFLLCTPLAPQDEYPR